MKNEASPELHDRLRLKFVSISLWKGTLDQNKMLSSLEIMTQLRYHAL